MVKLTFIIFLLVLTNPSLSFSNQHLPAIIDIRHNQDVIERFGLFELDIDISASYNNPFDPGEIDVSATFISPAGKSAFVHGFFYQDFQRSLINGGEKLEKIGRPIWKIRFTPLEKGRYQYLITVRDRRGKVESKKRFLTVRNSKKDGFIRRSTQNNRYLVFDSGRDYFAVGENVGWARQDKQTYDYEYFFPRLSENGCNYSRVWMVSWGLALEWSSVDPNAKGEFSGIGTYSLENAWRLDYIFELAEKNSIYFILGLGNYGDLMTEKGFWNEERWSYNPYNITNGGPCKSPQDFWTDTAAKDFYKNKLRYIIARWGYSTNLLGLEFWNEVSGPYDWTQQMAQYVKEIDPFGHLVTTSLGHFSLPDYSESRIWNLNDIDFTQVHLYGYKGKQKDLISELHSKCINNLTKYNKPCLFAEFGIDSSKDDKFYDRNGKGVNLHNGLWAAALSGGLGTAMNWWWDSYVEPKDLYYHFKAISNFAKTINWSKESWQNLEATLILNKAIPATKPSYSDLLIASSDEWRKAEEYEFTIRNNGDIIGGPLNKYLHGRSKDNLRVTPVFYVDYPANGKFIISIGTVSQGAELSVYVDGQKLFYKDLPASQIVLGKEGKSEYKKEWDIWWCHYDEDYAINISSGRHTIRLENTGKDWMGIEKITLDNYKDNSYPDVRIIGLRRQGEAIFWAQNIASDWYNHYRQIPLQPIKDIKFQILNMQAGSYQVDWWDTYKGEVTRREIIKTDNGKINLEIPELTADIACSVRLNLT